jgi:hypothetical protein
MRIAPVLKLRRRWRFDDEKTVARSKSGPPEFGSHYSGEQKMKKLAYLLT